ncbi:hypothetical protein L6452_08623 [Arctium lappa]|uniref:Uncharacterized protein n=1 Tax=Arctium lappa TaxID=4217 RepID=A0ACB9DHS1_ARCLA|nr:hypothetical protein L6452_08623 [Arctium lappa]
MTLHPCYTMTNIQHKVRVLDGTKVSYSSWVKLFQLHSKGYKVMSHIDGTPPPAETDAEYEAWTEIDAIVLQWIYGTLSDDLLVRVLVTESTANEAWCRIKAIFLNNKGSRAAALEHEFNNLTLKSMSSLEAYCQKLKELGSQLNDVDCPVNDQRLVLQLVRGLPAEYDTVASYINQSLPTWETACSMLELEHHRQTAWETMSTPTAMAAVSTEPPHDPSNYVNKRRPNNRPGHRRPNSSSSGSSSLGPRRGSGQPQSTQLPWPQSTQLPWNSQPNRLPNWAYWCPPPCPYPTNPGWASPWAGSPMPAWPTPRGSLAHHKSGQKPSGPAVNQANLTTFNPLKPTQLGEALQTMTMDPVDDQWSMDSGATDHLTCNQGKISKPSLNCPIGSIFVGNGAFVPVRGSGSSTISTPSRNLHLNNILYTPNIIKNLIFVRKFSVDNDVSIEFDPHGSSVKDYQSGQLLSRHNSSNRLYPLTYPVTTATFFTSGTRDFWHDRLGHPGLPVLDFLSLNNIIPCTKRSRSLVCNSCQLSKHKRLPFSDSNSTTVLPFDSVHCDLWTSPVPSKTGYEYYMVLLDDFTQYTWVFPMKFKSETFSKISQFHKYIQTQFNMTIKAFQCDLGGEFDNQNFKSFAETNGLLFHFSCPHTSQQNGKSERMIRRLNEIILALLTHASLPPHFWVEALHTACYLHNILPSKLLKFTTPMTALYHRQPSYDHLRVFGCACYPNTIATRKHKLEHRSTRCIFLGYPTNHHNPRQPSSPTAPTPQPPPTPPPPPPPPPPAPSHPMITRSRASRSQHPVNLHTTAQTIVSLIPTSHIKAFSDPHWHDAMTEEYRALMDNHTWDLVPRPPDANIIRCIWLFHHKFNENGTLQRYKARLVVNGKCQQVGIDCDETFSPVVKPTTIRTVLSLAVSRGWSIHQLDVKNAFLHGDLNETVFMFQPPGFTDTTHPNYVYRLRKSLYGLKQAPRAWYDIFATYITKCGFRSTDTSLFVYKKGHDMAIYCYMLTTSSSRPLMISFSPISSLFYLVSLLLQQVVNYYLTGHIIANWQELYSILPSLVRTLHMQYNKFAYSCMPHVIHTSSSSKEFSVILKEQLLMASVSHPPNRPNSLHILTPIGGVPRLSPLTSGYCVFLGDNLVSWSSKRQATISRSSAEAEYRGVANAVAETSWLRNLLLELYVPTRKATVVYCDNISAVYLSENPVQHQRTKHVELDIHFVREKKEGQNWCSPGFTCSSRFSVCRHLHQRAFASSFQPFSVQSVHSSFYCSD